MENIEFERNNISEDKTEIYRNMARKKIRALFEYYGNGKDSVEALMMGLKEVLDNNQDIKETLDNFRNVNDEEKFVGEVSDILAPFFKSFVHNALEDSQNSDRKFLNEVLSYNLVGDSVQIHIFDGEKKYKIVRDVKEGLEKLAEVVANNPEIKKVEAISWIVTKHPKLIEDKMGFIIGGDVDEKYIDEHFSEDDGEIKRAYIMRDDFLKKYLRNN